MSFQSRASAVVKYSHKANNGKQLGVSADTWHVCSKGIAIVMKGIAEPICSSQPLQHITHQLHDSSLLTSRPHRQRRGGSPGVVWGRSGRGAWPSRPSCRLGQGTAMLPLSPSSSLGSCLSSWLRSYRRCHASLLFRLCLDYTHGWGGHPPFLLGLHLGVYEISRRRCC